MDLITSELNKSAVNIYQNSLKQIMNKAIAAMLGVTGGVLGGFGSLIFVLRQRAKKYSDKIQLNQTNEKE